MPNVSLLPVPYVSQLIAEANEHNNDCGAACGVMFLRAVNTTSISVNAFYNEIIPSGDLYLSVSGIRATLAKYSVPTDWKTGIILNDLFSFLREGKPVIALILYSVLVDAGLTQKTNFRGPHFVVVVGMDIKNIYIHDPYYTEMSGAAVAIPIDTFLNAWTRAGENGDNPVRGGIVLKNGLGSTPPPPPSGMTGKVVVVDGLNMRERPDVNSRILKALPYQTVVPVFERKDGWARVEYEGVAGWSKEKSSWGTVYLQITNVP